MLTKTPPTPDTVTIQVGTTSFQGWQTVTITKSCESMPNNWSVSASAEFLDGDALAGTSPGQACLIYIGGDLVITGWIDRRSIPIDAHNRQVIPNDRMGSKIYQAFARPRTQDTLNWLRDEVIRCHGWMIADGVASAVEADTFFTGPGGIGARVTIVANGRANFFSYVWGQET